MRLSAPTQPVFLISVVLFVLALIGHFAHVPALSPYQLWLALAAYVVLAVANLLKGL
jgi:tryptophan-rich sensory protein